MFRLHLATGLLCARMSYSLTSPLSLFKTRIRSYIEKNGGGGRGGGRGGLSHVANMGWMRYEKRRRKKNPLTYRKHGVTGAFRIWGIWV